MNKIILFTAFLAATLYAVSPAQAQAAKQFGLILDDTAYNSAPRLAVGGKAAVTEPVFSLKDFTPQPGNQGECNSCVCWATCYAALTTSWAYKANITDKQEITASAKSPMFVYVQISNGCQNGTRLNDALKVVKVQGACSINDFNPRTYNGENKQAEIEPFKPTAYPYRIKDFASIFPLNADSAQKIDETKLSLINHQPVVVGMSLYPTFLNLTEADHLWQPNLSQERSIGAHAMCVVGYNDYQKTFEVMNSWGVVWGNLGFFNISYRDFIRVTKYAYQITVDERPAADAPVKVNGDFALEKFVTWDNAADKPVFAGVNPKLVNNEYTMSGTDINKGDYYRLFAKNVSPNCYIYVFSIDPNNKAEVLYPFSKNAQYSADRNLGANVTEVPRLYNGSVLEIPGNNKFIKTDVSGNDSMCILYAYNQIDDITGIVNKIKDSPKTLLMDKLKDVLGNRLMPEESLQYQPGSMSVSGTSKSGDIIPIVLKVSVN